MKLPTWLHREPEFDIEKFRKMVDRSIKDMTELSNELSVVYPNISHKDIEQIVMKSYSKGACRMAEYFPKNE